MSDDQNRDESSTTEQLGRAFASTRAVLKTVHEGQLDAATPCASWDVRSLINHFVGTARWAAATINESPEATDEDYVSGDALTSYDASARTALAAFATPGALGRTVTLAFGQFSGVALMNLAATDQFTHGWDLACAIGHPTDLDPDLAEELLSRARSDFPAADRGPDGQALFGPVLAPRTGASSADRLAAFLGRST
jgi:uncharacterized protein (TIGR03086 family)